MKSLTKFSAQTPFSASIFFHITLGKMCNKSALLQDEITFPDSVFSGRSSAGYSNARFTKDGWCTQTSQTEYLLIDLQKEYHITQVVTMGNKDQTKWIDRYTMAYSHDDSFSNKLQVFLIVAVIILELK